LFDKAARKCFSGMVLILPHAKWRLQFFKVYLKTKELAALANEEMKGDIS
jgi:hypothetical protein